jgi:hypothetical protein
MTDSLNALLLRLQQDGVDKGQQQAQEVLRTAKTEADRIVADAKQQAMRITADATAEAERLAVRGKASMQQAARDAVRTPPRMPRFSANLSMLFSEHPFLDRFEQAAKAGFQAVEFQFPYAFAAADIQQRLRAHGLEAVLHNLPAGDWQAGERGIACHPERVDEFKAGVAQAIDYAQVLGVPQLNCLAGKAPAGVVSKRKFAELDLLEGWS